MSLGTLYLDVYRDGFLIRREEFLGDGRDITIGAGSDVRVWLDSPRVDGLHANLEVKPEGRVILVHLSSVAHTFIGRRRVGREEVWRNAPIGIPPFVIVVSKRPLDPDPGPPPRNFPPLPPPPSLPKPEPGPAERSCPRCGYALADRDMPAAGPAYRSAPTRALACSYCDVTYWSAAAVATRLPLAARLADSPALQKSGKARGLCPECRQDLRTLLLSWGADWAEVEECGQCGLIAFGPGELEVVSRIVGAATR